MQPVVVTIAGSDAGGASGVQADLKSIAANGGRGASVVTAVTARSAGGVFYSEPISRAMLRAQLQTLLDDLPVTAVKTGLLVGAESIKEVSRALRAKPPPHIVCDPELLTRDSLAALWSHLFPIASLVTPTVHEAELLTGRRIASDQDVQRAGQHLLTSGVRAVLIKAHATAQQQTHDTLITPDGVQMFPTPWVEAAAHQRGIGCIYSAAIAAQLAFGLGLVEAITVAKEFVAATLTYGHPLFSLYHEDAAAMAWRRRIQGALQKEGP